MMLTLSVALSGAALVSRAISLERGSTKQPPVAAEHRVPRMHAWEALNRTLPDGALRLPSEGPTAAEVNKHPPVGPGPSEPIGDGPSGPERSQDGAETAADGMADDDADAAPAELRELHDRFSGVTAEVRQLAGENERARNDLATAVERLDERTATVVSDVRQLSGDYRHAREALAAAVKQTVTWLNKSRDEVQGKLDAVIAMIDEERSSRRDDMQQLRDNVTRAVVEQRTDHAAALAEASAGDRAALDLLSNRIRNQAALLAETLEQQKQLHQKLDGVSRLVDEARAATRNDMQDLRDNIAQAMIDQRMEYTDALAETSADDRAALDPDSNRLEEQAAAVASTLEQQKKLNAELTSLRKEMARTRRATPGAREPMAVDEVRKEVRRSANQRPAGDGPVKARSGGGVRKAAEGRSETSSVKRTAGKVGATKSGAAVKLPAPKPAARSATKAPAASAAVARTKRASGAAAPAKRATTSATARVDAIKPGSLTTRATTARAKKP